MIGKAFSFFVLIIWCLLFMSVAGAAWAELELGVYGLLRLAGFDSQVLAALISLAAVSAFSAWLALR
jgi:hypothetical protein